MIAPWDASRPFYHEPGSISRGTWHLDTTAQGRPATWAAKRSTYQVATGQRKKRLVQVYEKHLERPSLARIEWPRTPRDARHLPRAPLCLALVLPCFHAYQWQTATSHPNRQTNQVTDGAEGRGRVSRVDSRRNCLGLGLIRIRGEGVGLSALSTGNPRPPWHLALLQWVAI